MKKKIDQKQECKVPEKQKLNVENDYDLIMQNYFANPLFQQEWKMKNGYYEQYSVYDRNIMTVSGVL